MDTDELIAELLNAAECDEPGMLSILPETFANAAEALAKSVREATEWRQKWWAADQRAQVAEVGYESERERAEKAEAERDALRAVLSKYADLFCEGWCQGTGCAAFNDCSGCNARVALNAKTPDTP